MVSFGIVGYERVDEARRGEAVLRPCPFQVRLHGTENIYPKFLRDGVCVCVCARTRVACVSVLKLVDVCVCV